MARARMAIPIKFTGGSRSITPSYPVSPWANAGGWSCVVCVAERRERAGGPHITVTTVEATRLLNRIGSFPALSSGSASASPSPAIAVPPCEASKLADKWREEQERIGSWSCSSIRHLRSTWRMEIMTVTRQRPWTCERRVPSFRNKQRVVFVSPTDRAFSAVEELHMHRTGTA